VKEEKYMETHKATIKRDGTQTNLMFSINGNDLEINLTEDKPIVVKSVFNKLLLQLKKGEFQFELEDDKEDLFFHISSEYISQLNAELSSIYKELEDYDLLEIETTDEEE
tara:strand:- start:187 stop:516 length:330 start_codon:yes stop_codon:yes gene_type:complete